VTLHQRQLPRSLTPGRCSWWMNITHTPHVHFATRDRGADNDLGIMSDRRRLFPYKFSSSLLICSDILAFLNPVSDSRLSSPLTGCTYPVRSLSPPSPFSSRQRRHHILELLYRSQSACKYATPTVLLMSHGFTVVTSNTAPRS
jgi:hypothetical protein